MALLSIIEEVNFFCIKNSMSSSKKAISLAMIVKDKGWVHNGGAA